MISKNLKNFNLRQIADSGQCFRMIPCAPNDPQTAYRVISGGHFLIVDQNRDEVIFHCPNDEFAFWDHYFDLGTDYGAYIRTVDPADEYLSKAAAFGSVSSNDVIDRSSSYLTFLMEWRITDSNRCPF